MKKPATFLSHLAKAAGYVPKQDAITYIVPSGSGFAVQYINQDSDSLHEALGLTKERAKFITDLLETFFKREIDEAPEAFCKDCGKVHKQPPQNDLAQMIAELSKQCAHQNELAYLCLMQHRVTGRIVAEAQMRELKHGLRSAIDDMFKPKKNDDNDN